jgi:hypothetical protein
MRPLFIAIDPGLAESGVVVFDLEKVKAWIGDRPQIFEVEDVAPLIVDNFLIKTDPGKPLTQRLARLSAEISSLIDMLRSEDSAYGGPRDLMVAVEMPAVAGNYGRNFGGGVGTRANFDKLYMATGAIVGASKVGQLVRTPGTKKEAKRFVAERIWKAYDSVRRYPHSDVMDALFFGAWCLQRAAWTEKPV